MKEYACGDVVPGCGAVFRVDSVEEMLALCTVHARYDHDLTDEQMPDDLVARIRTAVRTTA